MIKAQGLCPEKSGRIPSTLIDKVCSDVILGEIMSDTTFVNYPTLVTGTVAERLHVPAQSSVTTFRPTNRPDCHTENPSGTCEGHNHAPDYSDGYGGTYAVGE